MYEDHFGFSERPFAAAPQVEHYFPSASAQAARERLLGCVERAEGVGMLVGPAGTGKTLMCRLLADHFRDRLQVALLPSARLSSPRALLQSILYELGKPYRGMDEGELRLSLIDYINTSRECSPGLLLLVDEAHRMPLRLMEEARLLTNLGTGGRPSVRLVLAGAGLLEERLAGPKLESLNQRIVARCYLEAFNSDETLRYIHQRIEAAGGKPEDILPEAACERVHQATDGVPRLINQVCDHALLLACAAGRYTLDAALVEEAWADLQQLPAPWTSESAESCAGGVVEFGTLEDPADQRATEAAAHSGVLATGASGSPPEGSAAGGEDFRSEFAGQGSSLEIGAADVPSAPPCDRAADPVERIERIEGLLAEAEAGFQPAGSIGPEVELVFDEPDRPFREAFAEEEIVPERWTPRLPTAEPRAESHVEPRVELHAEPRVELHAESRVELHAESRAVQASGSHSGSMCATDSTGLESTTEACGSGQMSAQQSADTHTADTEPSPEGEPAAVGLPVAEALGAEAADEPWSSADAREPLSVVAGLEGQSAAPAQTSRVPGKTADAAPGNRRYGRLFTRLRKAASG